MKEQSKSMAARILERLTAEEKDTLVNVCWLYQLYAGSDAPKPEDQERWENTRKELTAIVFDVGLSKYDALQVAYSVTSGKMTSDDEYWQMFGTEIVVMVKARLQAAVKDASEIHKQANNN